MVCKTLVPEPKPAHQKRVPRPKPGPPEPERHFNKIALSVFREYSQTTEGLNREWSSTFKCGGVLGVA